VAALLKARPVFASSTAGIVGPNATWRMDVCVHMLRVCGLRRADLQSKVFNRLCVGLRNYKNKREAARLNRGLMNGWNEWLFVTNRPIIKYPKLLVFVILFKDQSFFIHVYVLPSRQDPLPHAHTSIKYDVVVGVFLVQETWITVLPEWFLCYLMKPFFYIVNAAANPVPVLAIRFPTCHTVKWWRWCCTHYTYRVQP
jgi:hypothetical protein